MTGTPELAQRWWIDHSPGWLAWRGHAPTWLHPREAPPGIAQSAWAKARVGDREVFKSEMEAVAEHLSRPYQLVDQEWQFWWAFKPPVEGGHWMTRARARRIVERVQRKVLSRAEPYQGREEAERLESSETLERVTLHPSSHRAVGDFY